MTLRLRHHRPLMLLLVAAAVAAVAISWAKVGQTIAGAKPAVAPGRPTSIVWANRVFDSRAELRRWLRSRGSSYVAWERRYPSAAAILERRPAPTVEVTTTRRPTTPPPATRAVAAAATSSSGGNGYLRDAILALLAAAGAACAVAAATPTPVLVRFPGVAQAVVPHRELLLAGAAALTVGLLVGAVLT